MAKTLCKLNSKQLTKELEALKQQQPDYICKKCARAAQSKKRLCKPVSL